MAGFFCTIISGSADNDSIVNYGRNATISGGAGNDTIYSDGHWGPGYYYDSRYVSISGGKGNDYIYFGVATYENYIHYANGDGNDTISGINSNDTLQIYGSSYNTTRSGDDLIVNIGSGSILVKNGFTTSFKINNTTEIVGVSIGSYSNDTVLNGTSYADRFYVGGKNVTVNAGAGNDTIQLSTYGSTYDVTVRGGDGNDIINNGNNSYITIEGGAGDDTISNGSGSNIIINAGAGNDSVYNYGSSLKVDLGEGNDTIYNTDSYLTINAGAGNDSIYIYPYSNSGKNIFIQYSNGDGNDYISGLDSDDTLKISGASYTTTKSGNDLIIGVGSSSISVRSGATSGFNIEGNFGGTLDTSSVGGTDTGSGGSNTINNFSNNTLLSGTSSNDTINNGGSYVTINAGAGADYIYNLGNNVNINGGAGDDVISLAGSDNLITYQSGNGNDIIYGLKSNDTLQISGAEYSTVKSGKDLIINVGNNLLWAKNAANTNFKISGSVSGGGNDTTPAEDLPEGWKFTSTLATATLTSADDLDLTESYGEDIVKVNASKLKSGVVITGNDLNNSIKGGKGADTISGGAGNDTVSLGGGKDVITDYTAAQDKIQVDGTISKTSYKGDDVIFKIGSGTLTVKDAKGKNISVTDSSGTQTYSRTLDILYDNNFMIDDSNLDSITENKVAVTDIQDNKVDDLAQVSTLLTFAKEK